MDRLKRAGGLAYSNIMEAPHGAIATETFEGLLALGYAAALGTTERLVEHNPQTRWPASFGMDRSELVGDGMPVLPRIRMTPQWRNDVLIAALLRQPIILAGHHADAVNDLKLLSQFAALVNSLGQITWATPLEIARSNYKQFRNGDTLYLKLYSREIHLGIPEGVTRLQIERPWWSADSGMSPLEVVQDGRSLFSADVGPEAGPVPVKPMTKVVVTNRPREWVDYQKVPAPRPRLWPAFRKVLMEVRDRSMPWRRGVTSIMRRDPSEQGRIQE
jgi:hypothetical protein